MHYTEKNAFWHRFMSVRWRYVMVCGGLLIVLSTFSWSCIARNGAYRYAANAPRDPETELLLEAAPRTLGPSEGDKAVLFIHGFLGSGNVFWEVPDRVAAAGWHVEVCLLPGHGTTPMDLETVTQEELLNSVLSEIRALNAEYETVVVASHSTGGALSVLAAVEEPVDGLILGAPFFAVRHKWYYGLKPEWWLVLTKPFVRWTCSRRQPVNDQSVEDLIVSYPWVPTRAAWTVTGLAYRAADPDILKQLDMPVLLIQGTDDNVTSPKASAEAFAQISARRKRAVWLENSDHVLFWDYEREAVVHEILVFLEQLSAPPAL